MKQPSPKELRFAVLAVDTALFMIRDGVLHVLLGEITNPDFENKLGLIGGIVKPDEIAEGAVRRHLHKKAGIKKDIFLEQVYTFSKVDRDPRGRVVSVAYMALVSDDPQESGKAQETKWVPVSEVKKLAYDHDEILSVALERLRARIGYTNIAQYLLPKQFTLTELQDVYENVLGQKLDKRNFRRKVISEKLVKKSGGERRHTGRPAELFSFTNKEVRVIEIL